MGFFGAELNCLNFCTGSWCNHSSVKAKLATSDQHHTVASFNSNRVLPVGRLGNSKQDLPLHPKLPLPWKRATRKGVARMVM